MTDVLAVTIRAVGVVGVIVSDSDKFVLIWEQNKRLVEHNVINLTTFNSSVLKYMWNSKL
mgnify:CR=1 FL=1